MKIFDNKSREYCSSSYEPYTVEEIDDVINEFTISKGPFQEDQIMLNFKLLGIIRDLIQRIVILERDLLIRREENG